MAYTPKRAQSRGIWGSHWQRWGWSAYCLSIAVVALMLTYAGLWVRDPAVSEARPWPLIGLCAGALLMLCGAAAFRRFWPPLRLVEKFIFSAAVTAGCLALVTPLLVELGFQWDRWLVGRTAPERLGRFGQHIILGFNDWAEITGHVERRGVGGIFIRRHNVGGMSVEEIARRVGELQAARARQGLAPLWIATDQEGGPVARLSPPLPAQPTLREAITGAGTAEERRQRVAAYADLQASGLARIGVTVNFAPVADLDWGVVNPDDRNTRTHARAIAREPDRVAEVTTTYCERFAAHGVTCTLKHFPGIGRVWEDTHVGSAALHQHLEQIGASDLLPFRHTLTQVGLRAAVMLSHVGLAKLDGGMPASLSRHAVHDLVRVRWGFDGLIVTDDMCMGAIYRRRGSIGTASVASLNAGVDLVLVAWDSAQYYPVMAALLRAERGGALDAGMLAKSRARLERLARERQEAAKLRIGGG